MDKNYERSVYEEGFMDGAKVRKKLEEEFNKKMVDGWERYKKNKEIIEEIGDK